MCNIPHAHTVDKQRLDGDADSLGSVDLAPYMSTQTPDNRNQNKALAGKFASKSDLGSTRKVS